MLLAVAGPALPVGTPSPQPDINPQAAALISFQAALTESGALSSWRSNTEDPCTSNNGEPWYGVTCNGAQVTG